MASASVVFVWSSSLLIRRHYRASCQAEIPLIAPSEIVEPLLRMPAGDQHTMLLSGAPQGRSGQGVRADGASFTSIFMLRWRAEAPPASQRSFITQRLQG